MAFQQQSAAEVRKPAPVPQPFADSASSYQRHREVEAQQLALMAQHNLLDEWTTEVRDVVLNAREHVRAARAAREAFREEVRKLVMTLRETGGPLSSVLRQVRATLESLEESGAIRADGGWLEAEVLEWTIEAFEKAD